MAELRQIGTQIGGSRIDGGSLVMSRAFTLGTTPCVLIRSHHVEKKAGSWRG